MAGAWGLLPQALTAVALTVLATQRRMAPAVIGYGVALGSCWPAPPPAGTTASG
jgi:hypothetical protein